MTKLSTVGFTGSSRHDIILYLAAILSELNKRVLIQDFTERKELRYCIPCREEIFFSYRKIDYQFSREAGDSSLEEYDFIFMNTDGYISADCDLGYVVTDGAQESVKAGINAIKEIGKAANLIIRNTCEYKITSAFILNKFREADCRIHMVYDVPIDLFDYEYGLRMQYEDWQEFRNLSDKFKEMLIQMAMTLTDRTRGEVLKAYRRAGRRKLLCR